MSHNINDSWEMKWITLIYRITLEVGGVFYATSKRFIFKVNVLEAEKMHKH